MKIERLQYPVILPKQFPRPKGRLSPHQKESELSTHLGRIDASKITKNYHLFAENQLVSQASARAVSYDNRGGKPLSGGSDISSEKIETLWFRQKIEICPVIDIYV